MADNLHRFSVGERYHPDRDSWPEVTQYNWRGVAGGGIHEVIAFFRRPTPKEVAAWKSGPSEWALYTEDDQIILLFRFRTRKLERGVGWCDAPYTIHRVPAAEQIPPELPEPPATPDDPELRAAIHAILVDAADGRIVAQRLVSVSPEFTVALHQAIRDQAAMPWDPAGYDRRLRAIMSRHQTEDLVKLAQVRSPGGA